MKQTSRRHFLHMCTMVSLGFAGLSNFACSLKNPKLKLNTQPGYGPLNPDPQNILDLPKGFSYKIISRWGDPMSDGLITPNMADGMAAFPGADGKVVLIRNHEISTPDLKSSAFGEDLALLDKLPADKFYDYGKGLAPCLGGTTTLVFDEKSQRVEKQFLSLAGTIRNCAGGKTPWNSWITCEETTEKAGQTNEKDHGFNFEVPVSQKINLADPLPLVGMGRFNHEAVCVDPGTGIVYQTEDRHDGLIYRYIPNVPGKLARGGKLQALAIRDNPGADTRNWESLITPKIPVNQLLEVFWIDLENIEAPEDDLRMAGFDKGAARFARGEGMWFGDNELYFACTNGGHLMQGQVWRYRPSAYEGTSNETKAPGQLELFAEPNDTTVCRQCDNLTVSPWGDLILCEDYEAPYVIGLTPSGDFYKLAANVGHPDSEFAGATFSPSGNTLFLNIQVYGLTFAITGPWHQTAAKG